MIYPAPRGAVPPPRQALGKLLCVVPAAAFPWKQENQGPGCISSVLGCPAVTQGSEILPSSSCSAVLWAGDDSGVDGTLRVWAFPKSRVFCLFRDLPVRRKKLGGDTGGTGGPKWPEGYCTPQNVLPRIKAGQSNPQGPVWHGSVGGEKLHWFLPYYYYYNFPLLLHFYFIFDY